MTKRAEKQGGAQAPAGVAMALRQLVLPMVAGMVGTKRALEDLVFQLGLAAVQELFAADAANLVGPKHGRQTRREMNHWGSRPAMFPFGGREIVIPQPRVRRVEGGEVPLPLAESLREGDPLPARVVEQILLGVSTRGYAQSIGQPPPDVRSRGDSKSATSRNVVQETAARMEEFIHRKLGELDICVLMLDGLQVAEHAIVVALGVDVKGAKHPLGIWAGSTENKTICVELLQDLLRRGLRIEGRILVLIDGGKGLRSAVSDVLGTAALIQRCQNHKIRNVRDHLPKSRQAYAMRMMREAYKSSSQKTARGRLKQLVSWLESNGEDDAAASLREGLEETLTVLGLGISRSLQRSLATTNAIESLMGTIRRTTRNVKRWKSTSMIRRWVALSISTAQRKFRRLKGHADMAALIATLRPPCEDNNGVARYAKTG